MVVKGRAHAMGLVRSPLRPHRGPLGAALQVVVHHRIVGLTLRRAGIDQLVIDAFEAAAPGHGDAVFVLRCDGDARFKIGRTHLALERRPPLHLDFQVANLFAIEHASGHRHGLGLPSHQDVLARPCQGSRPEPQPHQSPPLPCIHCAPVR